MNSKPTAKANIEVASDQLKSELIEIKERLGALETIASVSNRAIVEEYVRSHLTSSKAKQIMQECVEPRTREQLIAKFSFAGPQALDHHLTPLRKAHLLEQHLAEDGRQTFEWSELFKGLSTKFKKAILAAAAQKTPAK